MRKSLKLFGQTIKWWVSQLPRRISNLIKWHKIVWLDHQKDYSKLLELLEYKFSLQSEYWGLEGNEKNFRYNILCKELAENIRTEHYLHEMMIFINLGKIDTYLSEHKHHIKKMGRKASYGIYNYETLKPHEKEIVAMDIASYKHLKAKKLLFKILYCQLENWQ